MRDYRFTCDWCGDTQHNDMGVLPEGWRLILVGTDEKTAHKWQSKQHSCPNCWMGGVTVGATKAETPSE